MISPKRISNSVLLRLQKYLAQAGACSRREGENLIRSGRVRVNGDVVTELGTKVDVRQDKVSLDGHLLRAEKQLLFRFFKPSGVVTTLHDPQGRPCVGDYCKKLPVRVFPVGRLDFDVSGLLLLTNDGEFAERLLHPRYEVKRVYWVVLDSRPSQFQLESLVKGVRVDSEILKATSAIHLPISSVTHEIFPKLTNKQSVVQLTVTEGRNHFVKNLFLGIGIPVVHLHRHQFGEFTVTGLRPGEILEETLRPKSRE